LFVDDDMTTGLVVHTDVDRPEGGINHRYPVTIWWFVRDAGQALTGRLPRVDDD